MDMAQPAIYGNIICQNGMPDLLRAIESIYPICDKIYVCDGGSTDGTWEWLENVKDIYNLEIFQHKYEGMSKQRNWLLGKTPKESWIISIDQDEAINSYGTAIRDFLGKIVIDKDKEELYHLQIKMVQMFRDIKHCVEFTYYNGAKIFYYKKNIGFGKNDYHAIPCNLKKEIGVYESYLPEEILLKHYAFLDPKRSKSRCIRLKDNKEAGKSEYEFWCEMKHKVLELPEELW